MWGLLGGLGVLVALWIGLMVVRISGVLVLVVVALFLAVGLNPAVEFLMRRGLKRPWAVLCVIFGVVLVFAGFLSILVPIISHQVTAIADNLPHWFDRLQRNDQIRRFDDKYDITTKVEDYVTSGGLAEKAFGGAVGVGLAILGILLNAFVVIVLTLYFLASLPVDEDRRRTPWRRPRAASACRCSATGSSATSAATSPAPSSSRCVPASAPLIFLFIVGLGSTPSRWRWWSPCST